jgi:hypothetical protein
MDIEVMKEIISLTANRKIPFLFLKEMRKGVDKKWVVGVMTQKLGIS